MAKTKMRLKSAAASFAPQSKEEVISGIQKVGDIQREITRMTTDMNDGIGQITHRYAPWISACQAELKCLQTGIQAWCEVNREALTQGGKTKTAHFTTGEVSWRCRPDSVSIKGADNVLAALKEQQLMQFIRIKEEINKDAILADKVTVKNISGIVINSGKEDFSIVPFEQMVGQ